MKQPLKGDHLIVELPASQVKRRLKGQGLGVRKVTSAGKGRALIVHTATGEHLRQLKALFGDAVVRCDDDTDDAHENGV